MIITLIGLTLLIAGIVLSIVYNKATFKDWETKIRVDLSRFIVIILGIIITTCASVFILVNVAAYDVNYQNMLHKKEMLEYRIDHMEENITGNEMLYNDIVEFNNELRGVKKWANNPWVSWFNNQDIVTIDYIVLDKE